MAAAWRLHLPAGPVVDFFIPGLATVVCSTPAQLDAQGTVELAIKRSHQAPAAWLHKARVGQACAWWLRLADICTLCISPKRCLWPCLQTCCSVSELDILLPPRCHPAV